MYRFSTYKRQYKANLKLALPVVMTQLGQILVQVADNVMVNAEDPALRATRQALLKRLYDVMNKVAEIARLAK